MITNETSKRAFVFSKKTALLTFFILSVIGVRYLSTTYNIAPGNFESYIGEGVSLHPAIYIAILTIVPVVFLPAFPVVIAGGVLYGHFWGLIYGMTGAVLGASLAFMFSRYIAGTWVEGKLQNSRWKHLYKMIEDRGWQFVILLRLVPLFPFTPLNYALGLTSVKFSHYLLATIIGILPACTAFIVFSTSLVDMVSGDLTWRTFLGILFFVLVMVLPLIYKKTKSCC